MRFSHDDAADELAGGAVLLAIGEEEILERQAADALALAQLERRSERDEGRREVADRRAVGDVAADRAGGADLHAAEAPHQLAEIGIERRERALGVQVADGGSEGKRFRPLVDAVESLHAPEPDRLVEPGEVLREPQADVGATGDERRVGMSLVQLGKRGFARRRGEKAVALFREDILAVVRAPRALPRSWHVWR